MTTQVLAPPAILTDAHGNRWVYAGDTPLGSLRTGPRREDQQLALELVQRTLEVQGRHRHAYGREQAVLCASGAAELHTLQCNQGPSENEMRRPEGICSGARGACSAAPVPVLAARAQGGAVSRSSGRSGTFDEPLHFPPPCQNSRWTFPRWKGYNGSD
jgi:hypothetical protein